MDKPSQEEKHRQNELQRQETLRQLRLVEKLATRLPWIVLVISLIAFVAIFVEVLLSR